MSEDEKTTDPRIAVALRYETGKDPAPRVTAKGRGAEAEKLIEVARAHGIVVEGNPFLAEALSRVALDHTIPEPLYRAVAAVIAFVLAAARKKGQREAPGSRAPQGPRSARAFPDQMTSSDRKGNAPDKTR